MTKRATFIALVAWCMLIVTVTYFNVLDGIIVTGGWVGAINAIQGALGGYMLRSFVRD